MKKYNLFALAAIAGMGLSACSQNPQTVPEADALVSTPVVRPPYSQQAVRIPKNQQLGYQQGIPHADPLRGLGSQNPYLGGGYIPTLPPQVAQNNQMPRLSRAELRAIGDQIFNNEGGGNLNNLVHWNDGEDFASMGIGHFTWYPAGRRQSFGNTFPGLLDYMAQNGVQLPGWLQQARAQGAPWSTREELMAQKNTPQVQQLQNLLYSTREIQAQYIVDRTRTAMPKLVKASERQSLVARNLNAVANTPGGWYALIDYVNFKGEGLGNGGYRGQNWGLRQVLEEMRPAGQGQQALHEFADAAMRVLQRRVQNSDPSRNEARWLRGWQNRVDTYRNPIV
ncbi:MAG TPA: hypothetical protein PLM98_01500 [Thiolinea sp.]|mgnify:CR=1 FL=1|nr:hypothetical protein [Thiolinea sp.]